MTQRTALDRIQFALWARVICLCSAGFLSLAGCKPTSSDDRRELVYDAETIDWLHATALASSEEIIKSTGGTNQWGKLYFISMDPNYYMLGIPGFKFIDASSVQVNDKGWFTYTDLQFSLSQDGIGHVHSHASMSTIWGAEPPEGGPSIPEFITFPKPLSSYVEIARETILETESIPGGDSDLQLFAIRVDYFATPQAIVVEFAQVSTIEQDEDSISATTFSRSLAPDGTVLPEKVWNSKPAPPRLNH